MTWWQILPPVLLASAAAVLAEMGVRVVSGEAPA